MFCRARDGLSDRTESGNLVTGQQSDSCDTPSLSVDTLLAASWLLKLCIEQSDSHATNNQTREAHSRNPINPDVLVLGRSHISVEIPLDETHQNNFRY